MKIILAHDSFTQSGGAERVFEAMHELYPNASVYTLVTTEQARTLYGNWNIITSSLQKLYHLFPYFQYLFIFIPVVLRFFKLEQADVLLSSSSAYLKGLRKPKNILHVQYCHTPTRFIWSDRKYAERELPFLIRPITRIYFTWLKRWDYQKAQRVDYFIANSVEVQKRIKQYYGRDSEVIYPFIDTEFWRVVGTKKDYFLLAGRLQPYKNNEMVIRLFNRLGLPLHIVGVGRQEKYLKSIAKANILFLGKVNDEMLREEYSGARAYIFPQLEDFGIMPLEAGGCGTPTIGLDKGGTLETITPGVTGELFNGTETALEELIRTWDDSKYTLDNLVAQARRFGKDRFKLELNNFIHNVYENRS